MGARRQRWAPGGRARGRGASSPSQPPAGRMEGRFHVRPSAGLSGSRPLLPPVWLFPRPCAMSACAWFPATALPLPSCEGPRNGCPRDGSGTQERGRRGLRGGDCGKGPARYSSPDCFRPFGLSGRALSSSGRSGVVPRSWERPGPSRVPPTSRGAQLRGRQEPWRWGVCPSWLGGESAQGSVRGRDWQDEPASPGAPLPQHSVMPGVSLRGALCVPRLEHSWRWPPGVCSWVAPSVGT